MASRSDEEKPVRWQQRKSAATREAILDAAVNCLVDGGYAGLTTIEITKRAAISRGAMHHHFANRAELLAALIDYVLHRRMERYLNHYRRSLPAEPSEQSVQVASDTHWQSVLTPEYTAFLELTIAARTDPALEKVLAPATRDFDREWIEAMRQSFPQWEGRFETMVLASDFAAALHVGLLVNRPLPTGEARHQAVKDLLVEVIQRLQAGDLP